MTQPVIVRKGKHQLRELQALLRIHFYKIAPSAETTSAGYILTEKNGLIQAIGEVYIPSALHVGASCCLFLPHDPTQ